MYGLPRSQMIQGRSLETTTVGIRSNGGHPDYARQHAEL